MPDFSDAIIRKIGRNIAFETGIRVALSLTGRLLLGVLCGLPATVISVNAAVAFLFSAVFELPTGIWADAFGKRLSVRVGYYCQVLANLSTFFAIALFPVSPTAMWTLIVLEGILDALGNSFMSGAREAAFQSIVESSTGHLGLEDREKVRRRYLSFAEAHGRLLLVAFPLGVIAALFLLHAHGGRDHYAMLLIVAGWLAIDHQFRALARSVPRGPAPDQSEGGRTLKAWLVEAGQCARALGASGLALIGPSFCWMVNRFVFITVTCYVTLAVIKDKALWPGTNPAIPVLIMTAIYLLGRLSRSFILPSLAQKFSNEHLVTLGAVLQVALAALVLWNAGRTGMGTVLFLAVSLGSYDVLSGAIERPSMGLILNVVPETFRATYLSTLSAVVLLAQFVYSIQLTVRGIGVPPLSEIWSFVLIGAGMMSLSSALRLAMPRQRVVAPAI